MSLGARVDAIFSPDGPLAATLVAFEPRDGQRRMAAAVADTLEDGGVLLVEAGTGTGKTLAYLVPAILSGQRVVVSTGTKNLQEQIFTKDLPLLARVLPVSFTATCMKGRGNYLCLQRYEVFKESPALRTDVDRVHFALIDAWAEVTDTGDRAEIDELPDDLPFWPQIAATSETCAGSTCPRFADCFVTRMRQRAAESDVVIVNHHLLCADASLRHHAFGEVIPESPALVIDEAHQLEDVATQHFGVAVSNYRVEALVDDAERVLRQADLVMDTRHALQRATLGLHGAGRGFFTAVAEAAQRASAAGPAATGPLDRALRADAGRGAWRRDGTRPRGPSRAGPVRRPRPGDRGHAGACGRSRPGPARRARRARRSGRPRRLRAGRRRRARPPRHRAARRAAHRAARRRSGLRVLRRDARRRHLPARPANRGVGDRARAGPRSRPHHGAHVGDADDRRRLRLRALAARRGRGTRGDPGVGVRSRDAGAALSARVRCPTRGSPTSPAAPPTR